MLHLKRTYAFEEEEALARLRALTDYWVAKHGLSAEWTGSRVRLVGKVMGVRFDADVRCGEGAIDAHVKAGFLAEKLGGKQYVERKLDDYLDPDKTVAELEARVPAG